MSSYSYTALCSCQILLLRCHARSPSLAITSSRKCKNDNHDWYLVIYDKYISNFRFWAYEVRCYAVCVCFFYTNHPLQGLKATVV